MPSKKGKGLYYVLISKSSIRPLAFTSQHSSREADRVLHEIYEVLGKFTERQKADQLRDLYNAF
ncbi:hypothetical protein LCGC14_0232500 [marine sediment metagenome]|uniref:Uncharacterized protein n=1 Tax=marine sediment metagenome TaxID=412755 RepID=A0A0F9UEN6_9ZZZZ